MTKIPVQAKQTKVIVHSIEDAASLPFSAGEYSRFKFGSKRIAHDFGRQLFNTFREHLVKAYGTKDKVPQIVVCSAPYNHIPTATGAMKDYFVKYLNEYLAAMGAPVVQETKVHRHTTYRDDYGALSRAERLELIGGDTFHIDVSFLKDKLVLFIDDIRITGSHEHMMEKMIMRLDGIEASFDHLFLYFAKLSNYDICPTIENDLNYAAVKSIHDIWSIVRSDDFLFNTRVVKYILNTQSKDMTEFLLWQDRTFLDTLYHLAIGNSYHLIPEYETNLTYVKQLLDDHIK